MRKQTTLSNLRVGNKFYKSEESTNVVYQLVEKTHTYFDYMRFPDEKVFRTNCALPFIKLTNR